MRQWGRGGSDVEEGGGGQIGGVASSWVMRWWRGRLSDLEKGKRERMDGLWGKCMDGMDGVPHRESTSVLFWSSVQYVCL